MVKPFVCVSLLPSLSFVGLLLLLGHVARRLAFTISLVHTAINFHTTFSGKGVLSSDTAVIVDEDAVTLPEVSSAAAA